MKLHSAPIRIAAAIVILAAVTFVYRHVIPVNPTTVALTYLVLVLLTSAYWQFRIALIVAFASTALFNYYFLPPYGTFTISDPQNWVALFAFLVTAVVASNLAERARRQAEIAQQRRQEVEQLYSLSQQLLSSDNRSGLFNLVPGQVAEAFGAQGAALVVSGNETVYRSRPDLLFDNDLLASAGARGSLTDRDGVLYVPLKIGVKPAGALAIAGAPLSRETSEALGSLVGIAAERARAIEELATHRAVQENEKLRTALLDSVTHEFRTPLTSIKASVTGLLDANTLDPTQSRELLSVINEETDRLNRLVGEAAEMAQLDANMFQLDKQSHEIRDVIDAAIESEHSILEFHPLDLTIPTDIPEISFDFDRIREVISHLLENAAKYSPKGSPIHISVEAKPKSVVISVADQGSGIDAVEQTLIFDKFYRGREHKLTAQGTGMGLAISKVIVEAHGGTISLVSQPGSGSVFSIYLPI